MYNNLVFFLGLYKGLYLHGVLHCPLKSVFSLFSLYPCNEGCVFCFGGTGGYWNYSVGLSVPRLYRFFSNETMMVAHIMPQQFNDWLFFFSILQL